MRQARWWPVLVFVLALVVLLPGLGNFPLFDVDEGAFSEATREMLAKGDYLSTWLNGAHRFDKPILIYWLQALSVSIFGISEWAFRLPSVLASAGWCAAVSTLARRRLGPEEGWMTAAITLTCLGVQLIGRAATADALLNCLLALTLVDLWNYLADQSKWAGRRMALWVGLGILTKGPIAVIVPGAACALWLLSYRQISPLLKLAKDPLVWLVFIASWLPWYIAAYMIHGDLFIQGFIMRHNVERFTGTLEGHAGSMFYYVVLVPLLVLPWFGWLASALRHLKQNLADPLSRFLWCWCGFVIIFFSFSGTKLPHYALYGCTPLFILIAKEWRQNKSFINALPVLGLIGLYAAIPTLLASAHVKDGFYAAQLARLDAVVPSYYLPSMTSALLVAVFILCLKKLPLWHRVAGMALIANFSLLLLAAPMVGQLLQGPVKNAALFARQHELNMVQWHAHWPSFSVYLGAETPLRGPHAGEVAAMRIDRLPAAGSFDELYREGGIALIQLKP